MTLTDKFLAELRLAGCKDLWMMNHISIEEREDGVFFSCNFYSAQMLSYLVDCSFANLITTVEFAHVDLSELEPILSLPSLRSLHLRFYYFYPPKSLGGGTTSRRLVIRNISLPKLPLLRELTLEGIYPEELEALEFDAVPDLTSLSINLSTSYSDKFHLATLPQLPTELERLSFRYMGVIEVPVQLMNIGSLQSIELHLLDLSIHSEDVIEDLRMRGVEARLKYY